MNMVSRKHALGVAILSSLMMLPLLSKADNTDDIRARIQKIGKINVSQEAASTEQSTMSTSNDSSSSAATSTADLYQTACFACHGTGVAGAPKLGDKAAWSARIALGEADLIDHAINGFKAMPPRGGSRLDDAELTAVVKYMIEQSQ